MTGTPWTNSDTLVASAVQAGIPIADTAPCVGLLQESLSRTAISAEHDLATTTDDADGDIGTMELMYQVAGRKNAF